MTERKSPYNNLKKISKRINGCKVTEIVKCKDDDWYIINGYNKKIYINNMSDFTINQVKKSIKT